MAAKFSYKMMEFVEDFILEQMGLFVNDVTGLNVFLLDKPWPAQIEPSVGIRILDYRHSGFSGDTTIIKDDHFEAQIDLRFIVEFVGRSGRPMANLAMLIQALSGFQEERYLRFNSNGIGLLSVSNATPANTVFDGIETEQRARMTATFNASISSIDILAPAKIQQVNSSIYTNVQAGRYEYDTNRLYEFYNGPHDESKEVQERLKRGVRTAVLEKLEVDFITT